MKRLVPVALAALALAAPATATPPVALQVAARENSYTLSTDKVRSGKFTIEIVNYGQDPHDLVVKIHSNTIQSVIVPPGQRRQLVVKLRQGTYELYCSLGDHRALGMDTTLRVGDRKKF